MKAAGRTVVVCLYELLFLLFLPTCLFPQLHRRLVKVTRPKDLLLYLFLLIYLLLQLRRHLVEIKGLKDSLLSDANVVLLFDGTLFATIVQNFLLLVISICILI